MSQKLKECGRECEIDKGSWGVKIARRDLNLEVAECVVLVMLTTTHL